jgi:hypothetical protein
MLLVMGLGPKLLNFSYCVQATSKNEQNTSQNA